MPPEKWFGIKSILEPDETILKDYGFYHLTNKRLIRSRLFKSKFEKIYLEELQISEDRRLVNVFFYPLTLGLALLVLAPILYVFAGMPFQVFLLNLLFAAGMSISQYGMWRRSRKSAYVFSSSEKKWRLITNGGPDGVAFVDKVMKVLSPYRLQIVD